jgi:hypothetical protein
MASDIKSLSASKHSMPASRLHAIFVRPSITKSST